MTDSNKDDPARKTVRLLKKAHASGVHPDDIDMMSMKPKKLLAVLS